MMITIRLYMQKSRDGENEKDQKTLDAVRAFNPYDLYSKSDEPSDVEELRPYYESLIAKFFPPVINW